MSAAAIQKRQMPLLKRLAKRSCGRSDTMIPLADAAPTLTITVFAGGARFTDKDTPKYEGGSDLAYDLNTLRDDGLIQMDYMTHKQDAEGGVIYEDPAIKDDSSQALNLMEPGKPGTQSGEE